MSKIFAKSAALVLTMLSIASLSMSCSKTFSNLSLVSKKLSSRYEVRSVGINKDGTLLEISLNDEAPSELPDKQLRDRAKTVAAWAMSMYPEGEKLSSIGISYINERRYLALVSVKKTRSFSFSISELKIGSRAH